ncbi:MAG: YceI family protein, partial [Bacteroidota bacterium]
TAQISTDNPKRDEHLRSQDFFAVDQYPSISFKSSSIDKRGDGYLVRGHLTILDATQEILIPFSFNSDTFKGQFVLNRLDFGLGKKFPTFFISNAVEVSIDCKVAAEVEV